MKQKINVNRKKNKCDEKKINVTKIRWKMQKKRSRKKINV